MKTIHMRNNQINLGIMIGCLLSFSLREGLAQGTHPTREFMRQKLDYSKGILEGITLEKYDLVITNAISLRDMNLTNAFLVLKSPAYRQAISHFQGKVDLLTKAAKEKNLGHSTKAYSEMVGSCVACHDLFRREQFLKHDFAK